MKIPFAKIVFAVAALVSLPLMSAHARNAHTSSHNEHKNHTARMQHRQKSNKTAANRTKDVPSPATTPTVEIFRDEAALLPTHDENSNDNDDEIDVNAAALIPPDITPHQ